MITVDFFVARDIIFNENLQSVTHAHDSEESDDDEHDLPASHAPPPHSSSHPPSSPTAASPSPPTPPPQPRRSTCARILTEGGKTFAKASQPPRHAFKSCGKQHNTTPGFLGKIDEKWQENNLPHPDFMLGDFNLTEDPLDRAPAKLDNENAISALRELRQKLNLQDTWRETHPTERVFTFYSNTNSHSRLDRIYTSPSHEQSKMGGRRRDY
jgi:endonuclease/exonuclease/phosphatase family metal-dependent hydrolase